MASASIEAGTGTPGSAAPWDEGAAARLLAKLARLAALDWCRRSPRARTVLSQVADAWGPLVDEAFDSGSRAALEAALRETARAWRMAAERAEGRRPPLPEPGARRAWARLLREVRRRDRVLARDVAAVGAAGAALAFDDGLGAWRLGPGRMGERAYAAWKARRTAKQAGRDPRAALREALKAMPRPDALPPSAAAPARAGFDPSAVEHEMTSRPSDLADALAAARRAGAVGLDVETMPGPAAAGLSGRWAERAALDPHLGRVRLVQLAVPGRPVLVFDVRRLWDLDPRERARALAPLAELLADPEVAKVGHNLKFDLRMLRALFGLGWGRRLRVEGVWDTMLADQLLACGQWAEDGYSLKAVARRRLGIEMDKSEQTSDWSRDLAPDQLRYAALDAAVLPRIRDAQAAEVERFGLGRAMALENGAVPAVADLEWAGLGFDRGRWEELREEVRARAAGARARLAWLLRRAAGGPVQQDLFGGTAEAVDPDSPKQVLGALRKLGVAVEDTRDETLAAVADREEVRALLAYRGLAKALSAFLDPYLEYIHPVTGRIHADFRQLNRNGVGRFSASDPNVQQWPRGNEYRSCVIPAPGRRLVIADYSAIEMRIMAKLSGDPGLTRVFREGADPHRRTAALIMGKPEGGVTKAERQMAKACFSGDTEILTPNGWVRFDQYDGVTPVAQFCLPEGLRYNPPKGRSNRWGKPTGAVRWNGDGGRIEFVRPIDFRSFDDQLVWRQRDRNTDLVLTPNHEVIFLDPYHRPRKMPAEEAKPGSVKWILGAGRLNVEPQMNEVETRILAMVVADGSFSNGRRIRLGFVKRRKIERCRWLLERAGVEYVEKTNSHGVTEFVISDPELREKLLHYTSPDKDLSWTAVTELDGAVYLDEAANWDAHVIESKRTGRKRAWFTTTRAQTAHVMQAMASVSGIPSVLRQHPSADPRRVDTWNLSYRLGGPPTWRASWHPEPLPERMRVWCVQVPSGAIIVRRNGRACVMGNCNFGLIYGMGAEGLRRYAKASYGVDMAPDEARRFREAFFRAYPGVAAFHRRQDTVARRAMAVRTLSGRMRRWSGPDMPLTELANTPDQGTGADILKRALARVRPRLDRLDGEIVNIVHDEIVLEVPEGRAEEAREALAAEMRAAGEEFLDPVPVEVEAEVGESWADK